MRPNSKVNITLMGGLGNQLFQYAFAQYVYSVSGEEVEFNDLNGSMRKRNDNTPEISGFNVTGDFDLYGQGYIDKFLGKWLGLLTRVTLSNNQSSSKRIIRKLALWNCTLLASLKYKQLTVVFVSPEVGFTRWNPTILNQLCLGYFQTYRFAQHPEVKQKLLNMKPIDFDCEILNYEALSKVEIPLLVHIRLGDYKNEPQFGLISTSYYISAIREQMLDGKYKKIWVFSDEISEYERYIPPEFLSLVRLIPNVGANTSSLLEVMRMCKGYVIANSTLSWWAAFLSYNQESIVYYPKPWFADLPEPMDLFPIKWISRPRQ
jgi:hypothetical protein